MTTAGSSSTPLFRRVHWLTPLAALVLAGVSVLIGQHGQSVVTSEPEHPITFVIEDGLPHGITQESVEAAAEGRALSREPFTMMVVERELEWDEYRNGELPEGVDVMLSVGHDPEDEDLVLPDATRVSVAYLAQEDDWQPHYRAATTIREVFVNNRTMGHGPSAVVGAGQTAGMVAFDGDSNRSPVFWGAWAAVPLLAAVLLILVWGGYLGAQRRKRRRFARARLQLARVVLELDTLEVQFLIAESQLEGGSRRLQQDWEAVRADSLNLARQEQLLHKELIDSSASILAEEKADLEPLSLSRFEQRAEALRRRADALMAAASVQVGLADSATVLGRLALPLTQAVEEILRHREEFDHRALERLEGQRTRLLSLVQEGADEIGDEPSPEGAAQQADLLKRWREAETSLVKMLQKLGDSLQRRADRVDEFQETVQNRVRDRIRSVTAGRTDSQEELRASLGVRRAGKRSTEYHAERVLALLEHTTAGDEPEQTSLLRIKKLWNTWFVSGKAGSVGTGVVALPILVGLIAGWAAVAVHGEQTTAFGRTLTGDQQLADLRIFGDPEQIPDYAVPPVSEEHPSNPETLTLDYIRHSMQRSAEGSDDTALLPDHVELTVALLPIDEYLDYQAHPEYENRIVIDYWELLDAYQVIREQVAAEYPEVIDSVTDEIELGQAILPVWLFEDDAYAVGLPLTGEISAGPDSRLGQYYFVATEPVRRNIDDGGSSLPLGSMVAYDLQELGRAMEYNHQDTADVSREGLFWAVAVAAWTGSQAVLLVLVAAVQAIGQLLGSRAARRQLAGVRERLNQLALGLDLSRIDMVAVLGGDDGDYGDAAEADQRLYEAALVTAWREVQVLESLPRSQQRGPEWTSRVAHMDRLVESLSERDVDVAQRALALVRS